MSWSTSARRPFAGRRSAPFASLTNLPSLHRLPKIDRAQDHAGRIALQFDIAEFARGAFLDAVAQALELLLALCRRRSRRAVELFHRVGKDGAGDIYLAILHRQAHNPA